MMLVVLLLVGSVNCFPQLPSSPIIQLCSEREEREGCEIVQRILKNADGELGTLISSGEMVKDTAECCGRMQYVALSECCGRTSARSISDTSGLNATECCGRIQNAALTSDCCGGTSDRKTRETNEKNATECCGRMQNAALTADCCGGTSDHTTSEQNATECCGISKPAPTSDCCRTSDRSIRETNEKNVTECCGRLQNAALTSDECRTSVITKREAAVNDTSTSSYPKRRLSKNVTDSIKGSPGRKLSEELKADLIKTCCAVPHCCGKMKHDCCPKASMSSGLRKQACFNSNGEPIRCQPSKNFGSKRSLLQKLSKTVHT